MFADWFMRRPLSEIDPRVLLFPAKKFRNLWISSEEDSVDNKENILNIITDDCPNLPPSDDER